MKTHQLINDGETTRKSENDQTKLDQPIKSIAILYWSISNPKSWRQEKNENLRSGQYKLSK